MRRRRRRGRRRASSCCSTARRGRVRRSLPPTLAPAPPSSAPLSAPPPRPGLPQHDRRQHPLSPGARLSGDGPGGDGHLPRPRLDGLRVQDLRRRRAQRHCRCRRQDRRRAPRRSPAARPGDAAREPQAAARPRHPLCRTGADRRQAGSDAGGLAAGSDPRRSFMTVAGAITRPFSPLARWIMRRMWWVEHAFERARASDKAVDDTRLRIFFVLALFAAGFVTLALGAGRAALFSPYARVAEPLTLMPGARAELVDRNGQVLALDLPRFGLYVDPREMLHKDAVRAALLQALPGIDPAKLGAILAGTRREYLLGELTAAQQAQVHDLGL